MDTERFQAPEILFSPYLINMDSQGIAEQLFMSINKVDVDVRPGLYKHIVLSGGSSMYPGLPTRLEKEIKDIYTERVLKGDSSRLSVSITISLVLGKGCKMLTIDAAYEDKG